MTDTPGLIELRQRQTDNIEAMQTHLDGRQAQIHTSMPGKIVSFDPAKMTATVQPAIQGINTKVDGTRAPVTLTTVSDVPVHFPAGGGYTLTFPVKPGDECMLVFMERSIDNWHQQGGVQTPSDHRMHDINDCIAHVGLRSQPNVIPALSTTSVQMRSDGGGDYVEVSAAGITVKTAGTITLQGSSVKIITPGNSFTLETHTHTQGSDGHGDSEVPTNAPLAGS
jgi:hypothetical protein